MDPTETWLTELARTPEGSLILFLAVFLARVYLDRWDRGRARRPRKKKEA